MASSMYPSEGRDREAVFLSQLDLIERVIAFVCARQHVASTDADDFSSFVKLKFVENDYALLAKFEGRSSLRTFLTVVIQRLFLDHRITAWGKWRPSATASSGQINPAWTDNANNETGFNIERSE